MREIAASREHSPEASVAYVKAWIVHLPQIYPVGVLLGAAAVTDADAAAVFTDRMVGSLHARHVALLAGRAAGGHLAAGWSAGRAADLVWPLTHIDAWRQLVVERGWTPADFRADRAALISARLLRPSA